MDSNVPAGSVPVPFTPVALLSSRQAPTTMVSPDPATELPKTSPADTDDFDVHA